MPEQINVVDKYAWTSAPKNSGIRAEAPRAIVTSYEMKESALRSFVSGYTNIFDEQKPLKFYKNLYKVRKKTKQRYVFPYFEDNFRSFANNYADTFSQISQRGAQFVGQPVVEAAGGIFEEAAGGGLSLAAQTQTEFGKQFVQKASDASATVADKLGLNNLLGQVTGRKGYEFRIPAPANPAEFPGTYIETPKFFQYANTDAAVEINFILANTIEEGDIADNQKLIETILTEARPERKSSIQLSFPRIYEVDIPGLRFIQWASLASIAVNLLGARRMIDERVVPEAYAISLTFQSLTLEPSNFIEKANMS